MAQNCTRMLVINKFDKQGIEPGREKCNSSAGKLLAAFQKSLVDEGTHSIF